MRICIRVQAKTDPGSYRVISFHAPHGPLRCDCSMESEGFCSHIDAVLNAGERFMVHPDDRETADLLMQEIAPIAPPLDWKASWRRNRRWRGLPVVERAPPKRAIRHVELGISEEEYAARPVVVFTGQFEQSRTDLVDAAKAHGWQPAGTVRDDTRYLVASTTQDSSRKRRDAERKGIRVITIDEWLQVQGSPD